MTGRWQQQQVQPIVEPIKKLETPETTGGVGRWQQTEPIKPVEDERMKLLSQLQQQQIKPSQFFWEEFKKPFKKVLGIDEENLQKIVTKDTGWEKLSFIEKAKMFGGEIGKGFKELAESFPKSAVQFLATPTIGAIEEITNTAIGEVKLPTKIGEWLGPLTGTRTQLEHFTKQGFTQTESQGLVIANQMGRSYSFVVTFGLPVYIAGLINRITKAPTIEKVYRVEIPPTKGHQVATQISKQAKLPKPTTETALRSDLGQLQQTVGIKGHPDKFINITTNPLTGDKSYFSFTVTDPSLKLSLSTFVKNTKVPQIPLPKGVDFPTYNASLPGATQWFRSLPTDKAHTLVLKEAVSQAMPAITKQVPVPLPKVAPQIPTQITPTKELDMVTSEQITAAHTIAKNIGLIKDNQPVEKYREIAMETVGKASTKEMTKQEANAFISKLKTIEEQPPVSMTEEMAESKFAELTNLREIGYKERFRGIEEVFDKIGITEDSMFDPDVIMTREADARDEWLRFKEKQLEMKETVSEITQSEKRIWNHLNNTLEKGVELTKQETRVVKWAKGLFDEWADKLKLPQEKRKENYVTHIFEEEIKQALDQNMPIGGYTAAALDFTGIPEKMFHPYLQKRLGADVGLKEDVWASLDAYVSKSIQVYHYEPLLEKLAMYEKFAPENTARFLKEYSKRLTHQPLQVDKEIKQDMKEFAGMLKQIPGMEEFAANLEKGNPAGVMAHSATGILYEMWLGFRPASAIKNISQQGLALSEVGPVNYFTAKGIQYTKEGKNLIKQSIVMRGRETGFFLPGVDETFLKQLHGKRREVAMYMFKKADKDNVGAAFLSGYTEAKNLGLPHEWAIKRGDEVARKTQYVYTKLMAPEFNQSVPGRVLSVFTTWPRNWAELMNKWAQGKPSKVYMNYVKETGKSVEGYEPDGTMGDVNFKKNKKALWRYLMLVGLAMGIQQKTRVKALYYTGWTAIESLAQFAQGNLPGLSIPGDILGIVAAASTGDTAKMKRHWKNIRPDRQVLIIRQLQDIISGKKDWLNLFFYLDNKKDGSPSSATWPSDATPMEFKLDLKDFELELNELEIQLEWKL